MAAEGPRKMIRDRPDDYGPGIDIAFTNVSPIDGYLIMPGLGQAGRIDGDLEGARAQGGKDQGQNCQGHDADQKIDRPPEIVLCLLSVIIL